MVIHYAWTGVKPQAAGPKQRAQEAIDVIGGEGGIRTPVPLTGQDAFEAPPLRPLRYLSAEEIGGAANIQS